MKRVLEKPILLLIWGAILVSALFLSLMLTVSIAHGKDKKEEGGLDPLRPADTSSPRDTINSFLSDTKQLLTDYRQETRSGKTYRAIRRATQALDFSTTTEGDSWYVRNRRIALLHELLARIELPPDRDIPGDEEVEDGTITEWAIPDTNIIIKKIIEGPRNGQFLFSAGTVQ